ncbi:MAG: hypothetical protein Rpha_0749 [Candidatus Ruthia sp. Apha_13_S6]|nr:hypothetical protein [Candidatus Ruthia sp. Apha_13_S6]
MLASLMGYFNLAYHIINPNFFLDLHQKIQQFKPTTYQQNALADIMPNFLDRI